MATNTEVEIIKFEGDVSNLKKSLKDAENSFSTTETKAVKSAKTTEKAFSGLGTSIKSALSNLPFGGLVNDLDNAANSAKSLGAGISSIQGSSGKAGTGIKALTGLIGVGLLGAVALAVAAISSLVAFVKSTDEGAARLEATFNGLSAATDVVIGRFAQFGSSIADADSEGNAFTKTLGVIYDSLKEVYAITLSNATGGLFDDIAEDAGKAYDAAYALSLELDAIQDEMRLLGVESKQTDLTIQSLLKQAKNRGNDVTTRLALVAQAQELENSNLGKNFELQKRYYANIANTNVLALEAINSGKKQQVNNVKAIADAIQFANTAEELLYLYREQIKAQEGLLSISDEQAENQVDGLQKIIELAGRSEVLQEKYAGIQSQLIEKDIADRTNAIKAVERERTAAALNTIKSDEQLAAATLDIQIHSLQQQRTLLKSYGKDVSQIDLDIATLRRKYEDDLTKKKADALAKRLQDEKAYNDAQRKLAEENFNKSIQDVDENTKFRTLQIRENANTAEDAQKQELQLQIGALEQKKILNIEAGKSTLDIELELQEKKKKLYESDVKDYSAAQAKKKQATINTLDYIASNTSNIYNGLSQNQAARTQNELAESQKSSQKKVQDLQQQLDAGVISQEKYTAQVKQIQFKQAQVEASLKARQAKADKQSAIFNIIINTAAAIAKTLAMLGIPLGIPASIAAAAAGAAQLAIVSARPLPKYKDGVIDVKGDGNGTSDSIDAKISRGESVMTADETKQHKGLLWAIRKNKLDEYADRAWVKPAIKMLEHEKAIKHRNGKSVKNNKQEPVDTSLMEHLIKKNKSVRIENWHEMPKEVKGRKIV